MLILVSRKKGEQTLKQFLFEISKLLNLVSRKNGEQINLTVLKSQMEQNEML